MENLCRARALALFDLDPKEWGVNVQAYSGKLLVFYCFFKEHVIFKHTYE